MQASDSLDGRPRLAAHCAPGHPGPSMAPVCIPLGAALTENAVVAGHELKGGVRGHARNALLGLFELLVVLRSCCRLWPRLRLSWGRLAVALDSICLPETDLAAQAIQVADVEPPCGRVCCKLSILCRTGPAPAPELHVPAPAQCSPHGAKVFNITSAQNQGLWSIETHGCVEELHRVVQDLHLEILCLPVASNRVVGHQR
mmetsp:Transcript_38695/g.71926  ORF Transcript_38695/g.71926 Transcript_38695/m.71926 type:complete len:201 (+) Transcript_38695:155-757(+)